MKPTTPDYLLTLRPIHPGPHPEADLKRLLKRLLRDGKLRCVEIRPVHPQAADLAGKVPHDDN